MVNRPAITPIAALRLIEQFLKPYDDKLTAWHAVQNELFALRAALATEKALREQTSAICAQVVDGEHLRLLRRLLEDYDRITGGKETHLTAQVRALLAGVNE